MKNFKEELADVTAFVFDCDGVFTNGDILLTESGEALRSFNAKDGYAIALAVKRGYPICIISGGVGEVMRKRFLMLGVTDIYLGCEDKMQALHDFVLKHGLEKQHILAMGDDMPDIEVMRSVGVPVAPKDAAQEVKNLSRYVSAMDGGKGCVRDVIEQVLKAQERWSSHAKDVFSR